MPCVMLLSLGTDLLCACHPDHGGRSLKDLDVPAIAYQMKKTDCL